MPLKTFGKLPKGAAFERVRSSSNFNGQSFNNPIPTQMGVKAHRVMKDYFKTRSTRKPEKPIPIANKLKNDFTETPSKALKLMWLGHASLLIEIERIRILTDPVFSDRVSPFAWMGPKRMHDTPFSLNEMPDIDVIVISHNHYDHLDLEFINYVKDHNIRFVVPLAVGETLQHWGIDGENIVELDWHESYTYNNVSFTATPARHFTGRGLLDRNKAFWMSTVIKGSEESLFFCGDSVFFEGFEDIGHQYGAFNFTMIGIGAYNEQWQAIHTNPKEALKAHNLLRGKHFLPIHWCTFDLAPHPWMEPVEWLMQENQKIKSNVIIPKAGEFVTSAIADQYQQEFWWR